MWLAVLFKTLRGTITLPKGTRIKPNRESCVFKSQRSKHLPKFSSDYFTKYEWADLYGKFSNLRKWLYVDKSYQGDHFAHGFYADGTASNGSTLGFWTVFNNLEGYTGGPLRSDLVVDTNIYNCTQF